MWKFKSAISDSDSELIIFQMSKRTRSAGSDEPPQKRHCRIDDFQGKSWSDVLLIVIYEHYTGNQALYDNGAWDILEQFLTTSMSLPEMDDALVAYLGDRYSTDDWVEPRRILFSGDENDAKSLENLRVLREMYIPNPPEKSSRTAGSLSKSRVPKSRRISKVSKYDGLYIHKVNKNVGCI